jgi:hypothetical protein
MRQPNKMEHCRISMKGGNAPENGGDPAVPSARARPANRHGGLLRPFRAARVFPAGRPVQKSKRTPWPNP